MWCFYVFLPFSLRTVLRATTPCTFWTSELPKVLWRCCVLHSLISKCASRHTGVHFLNIIISLKWSEHVVLLLCWLRNVLRATTASTFSTSQLPKVFRRWRIFSILTSTCASRHNGVQFFIAHQTRWLRTRRFSEPTFLPYRATEHGKTQWHSVSRLFYLFVRLQLLSSDSFSSLIFFLLPVSSLTPLPTSAFSSVHTVRSLPSKLPAISIGI